MELNGLSSLKELNLHINSPDRFLPINLKSLKELTLTFKMLMNEGNSTRIFENVSNIYLLDLNGCFSNLNLDSLVKLKKLSLSGEINDDFNFGLLKKLSNHLQTLLIQLKFDNDQITNLFDGHEFKNLQLLIIKSSQITKLEMKMFKGFRTLPKLSISFNPELLIIDSEAFSNLTNLVDLKLNDNLIEKIDHGTFSALTHLQTLNLSKNKIESLEENIFSNLNNLTNLDLSYNQLSKLKPKSFLGLSNLEALDLSKNKLTDFDIFILDYISKICFINLQSNQIRNQREIIRKLKDLDISFETFFF